MLHNIFFALLPDAEAADQIVRFADELRREHGLTGPSIVRRRLHISLNNLGVDRRRPAQLIGKACEIAATVTMPVFTVGFDHAVTFETKTDTRPVVLTADDGVIGVSMLHERLHTALAGGGLLKRRARLMQPHLTILRDRRKAPLTPHRISWRVREFALIESFHGEGRYDVLGRWPLRDLD